MTGNPRANRDNEIIGDGSRRISGPLMLGLLTLPLIFGWLLLRPGYAKSTRITVAIYALFIPFLIVTSNLFDAAGL
ncbi:hypothetical protein [Aquisediminimonas profunda]|uniref:hypothetical protein n=1 Tax=Aquisediminimonas profunda TaxID=1550733 RepID=UPI001C628C87|nr:hypothetical protein [Aquisediminimonas profunda]